MAILMPWMRIHREVVEMNNVVLWMEVDEGETTSRNGTRKD
jgi:hypothetical protein